MQPNICIKYQFYSRPRSASGGCARCARSALDSPAFVDGDCAQRLHKPLLPGSAHVVLGMPMVVVVVIMVVVMMRQELLLLLLRLAAVALVITEQRSSDAIGSALLAGAAYNYRCKQTFPKLKAR